MKKNIILLAAALMAVACTKEIKEERPADQTVSQDVISVDTTTLPTDTIVVEEDTIVDDSKEALVAMLEAETEEKNFGTNKSQWTLLYDDYDKDGLHELIFATGDNATGVVTVDGIQYMQQADMDEAVDNLEVNNYGAFAFISYSLCDGLPRPEGHLWKLKKGVLEEQSNGMSIYHQSKGVWECGTSEFCAMYDAEIESLIGRCYFTYFYQVQGEKLVEVSAKEISMPNFKNFLGTEAVLAEISAKGGEIQNVILRANDVIDVNYIVPGEDDSYELYYCRGQVDGRQIVWEEMPDGISEPGNISLQSH